VHLKHIRWEGPELAPGAHVIEFDCKYDGLGPGSVPTGTPVDDDDFQIPFAFTGKLNKITLTIYRPELSPKDIKRLQGRRERLPRDARNVYVWVSLDITRVPSSIVFLSICEVLQFINVDQLYAAALRQSDQSEQLELGEGAAHGLDGQTKKIADVGARHW